MTTERAAKAADGHLPFTNGTQQEACSYWPETDVCVRRTITLATPAPTLALKALPMRVERTFRRTRRAVPRTRRFVGEAISGLVPDDRADDILLCTSELATNALQHTPPGRMFRVSLTLASDALRIEVHDAGDGLPQLREATKDDDRGRGLLLVAALADDWGTSRRDGPGKSVWAAFQIADARGH
ncbi:ATP-binding protein [Streptomyces luteolus]|uniref:ATP-binding protein n=1 Tax=Streptomyces luteolus TaxID=3043615 RepID=A0ABT6T4U8_9ACTN|nr:ATP-binding protein [Streptomyces sp. B-S-A12]MDI3422880.1 ATP-binding protein [Streptomyces sp. B-S-A12]